LKNPNQTDKEKAFTFNANNTKKSSIPRSERFKKPNNSTAQNGKTEESKVSSSANHTNSRNDYYSKNDSTNSNKIKSSLEQDTLNQDLSLPNEQSVTNDQVIGVKTNANEQEIKKDPSITSVGKQSVKSIKSVKSVKSTKEDIPQSQRANEGGSNPNSPHKVTLLSETSLALDIKPE